MTQDNNTTRMIALGSLALVRGFKLIGFEVVDDGVTWSDADTMETLSGPLRATFSLWYIEEKAPNYYFEEPATFVINE